MPVNSKPDSDPERPCVVCDGRTECTIEGGNGDGVPLCQECWQDRRDNRVSVPLAERGVLTQSAVGAVLQSFHDSTVKTEEEHLPEFTSLLPDWVAPTAVRRAQPLTLAQLAGVKDFNDGWSPYNAVFWDVEDGETPVVTLAGVYGVEGDYAAMGATLYVGETIETLRQQVRDHSVAGVGGGE